MRTEIPLQVTSAEYEKRENCALVGLSLENPTRTIYQVLRNGLIALQHRGEQAAGISYNSGGVEVYKDLGFVDSALPDKVIDNLPPSSIAFGHTRYSTVDDKDNPDKEIQNSQPFKFRIPYENGTFFEFSLGHNGTVITPINDDQEKHGPNSDTYMIGKAIVEAKGNFEERVTQVLSTLNGAYMLLFVTSDNRLYAASDPWGFKPGAVGYFSKDGPKGMVFASETLGIEKMGGKVTDKFRRGIFAEIKPDIISIVWSDPRAKIVHPSECSFEKAYFGSHVSKMREDGVTNHTVRYELGMRHAELIKPRGEQVTPVPNSGNSYADGVANQLQLPVTHAIFANPYRGRNFTKPHNPEERKKDAFDKFSFIPEEIIGRKMIVVDDSIVRGTTVQGLILALFELGAESIELLSGIPPLTHPCYWGIDFPTPEELIFRQLVTDEDRENYEVKLANWLVDDNPDLANRLRISFQKLEDYVSITQNVPINTPIEESGGCYHCVSGVVPQGVFPWEKD